MTRNTYTRRGLLGRIGTAGVTASLVTVAGCSGDGGGDGGGSGETVEMTSSLAFEPSNLTISPGTTVTWETTGGGTHTVTAYDDGIPDDATYFASGEFDSEQAAHGGYPDGSVENGETYEHTFETSGTYEYFCIPHEGSGMTGTVTVE